MNIKKFQSGFTMVELVVALAISAIVLAAAAPSFREAIKKNRMTAHVNDFVVALSVARSEAIKRASSVAICKSSDGASCATSGQWEGGWIIFDNKDNDSPAVVDTNADVLLNEPVIRVYPALSYGHTLRASANFTNDVTFLSSGESDASGNFVICTADEDISDSSLIHHARAVFINAVGRAVLAPDRNTNGIPENASGSDITTCTP